LPDAAAPAARYPFETNATKATAGASCDVQQPQQPRVEQHSVPQHLHAADGKMAELVELVSHQRQEIHRLQLELEVAAAAAQQQQDSSRGVNRFGTPITSNPSGRGVRPSSPLRTIGGNTTVAAVSANATPAVASNASPGRQRHSIGAAGMRTDNSSLGPCQPTSMASFLLAPGRGAAAASRPQSRESSLAPTLEGGSRPVATPLKGRSPRQSRHRPSSKERQLQQQQRPQSPVLRGGERQATAATWRGSSGRAASPSSASSVASPKPNGSRPLAAAALRHSSGSGTSSSASSSSGSLGHREWRRSNSASAARTAGEAAAATAVVAAAGAAPGWAEQWHAGLRHTIGCGTDVGVGSSAMQLLGGAQRQQLPLEVVPASELDCVVPDLVRAAAQ